MLLQVRLAHGRYTLAADPPVADVATDLVVDIVSDVVCPWCYIGKRKLETALAELQAREPGLAVLRRWHPFQLNPDLPDEGIDRATYIEAKFGGKARAAEVYARVRAAGAGVGIAFDSTESYGSRTRSPRTC